jgi:hypothetical protein
LFLLGGFSFGKGIPKIEPNNVPDFDENCTRGKTCLIDAIRVELFRMKTSCCTVQFEIAAASQGDKHLGHQLMM